MKIPPRGVFLRPSAVLILVAWTIARAWFVLLFWHVEGVGHVVEWLKKQYIRRLQRTV